MIVWAFVGVICGWLWMSCIIPWVGPLFLEPFPQPTKLTVWLGAGVAGLVCAYVSTLDTE